MDTTEQDREGWTGRLAAQFGLRLKAARTNRVEPLSAAMLARRCQELGGTITRDRIAAIEIGRREVSVADLLVLAAALGVSPAWLVAPAGSYDHEITEVLPGVEVSTARAYGWISGRRSLNPWAPSDDWERTTTRAELVVEHEALIRYWVIWAEDGSPDGQNPDLDRLREVRRLMRVVGIRPPELPGHLSARLVDGGDF